VADGEAFWARISALADYVRASAPEGKTVVVTVETFDGHTFVPMVAQRSEPWVLIETGEPSDPENLDAREIVFIREDDIRRIYFRRVSGDKAFGFRVGRVLPE
jgi:hypothetical protein